MPDLASVLRLAALPPAALAELLRPWGIEVETSGAEHIPGSYWGETEAGLIGRRLIVRADTPVHSALHEACHFICAQKRDAHFFERGKSVRPFFPLHTDAGGDDLEECAVCYLQILLADRLAGFSRERMLADMDAWGYSFRLGSARAWFERDAADARAWLAARGLLVDNGPRMTRTAP